MAPSMRVETVVPYWMDRVPAPTPPQLQKCDRVLAVVSINVRGTCRGRASPPATRKPAARELREGPLRGAVTAAGEVWRR
jgi:hypothetical protein